MKLLAMIVIVALGAWQAYERVPRDREAGQALASTPGSLRGGSAPVRIEDAALTNPFRCDGRQHCSQMTSCAEATFFLKTCPGTKMDGDDDGVPCERQWCTSLR